LSFLAFSLTALLLPTKAAADPVVLASVPVGMNGTGATPTGYFTFAMGFGNWLFTEYALTEASVGTTFVANRTNDPQFAEIARKLTNGLHSYTEYLFGSAPGTGGGIGYASEGQLFQLGPAAVDFRGATITALTFRLDSFNGPFAGQLSVLGEGSFDAAPTPEPASLVLLTSGMLGVYLRQRRRTR
jgi:hypothetical protein